MGEIAHADEELLYRMFGVDAELLIDHAWGREPVTMADIKNYKPKDNSLFSGQVLAREYSFDEARLVVKEMADSLSLELAGRGQMTESVTLHVGYARRFEKKSAHGTERLPSATGSSRELIGGTVRLYDRIVDRNVPVKRISLGFNRVTDEPYQQYSLFQMPEKKDREDRMQRAVLNIKGKFGRNALLRGIDLQEGATAAERNTQIGGHRSGI